MQIAEIFRSVQGEGLLTGTESVFVRVAGCNLRCAYCDTPYASWMPSGEDLAVDEVVARVERLDPESRIAGAQPLAVVLTGGEPMLCAEMIPLTREFRNQGRHITIETNGTLFLPVACDLMSISPKLSNSTPAPTGDPRWTWRHETTRYAPEAFRRLVESFDYQIKFVVGARGDCSEAEGFLADFPQIDRSRVLLMPQGIDAADLEEMGAWLEPYCRRRQLRFCPRKHIEWFGQKRGA